MYIMLQFFFLLFDVKPLKFSPKYDQEEAVLSILKKLTLLNPWSPNINFSNPESVLSRLERKHIVL